MPDFLLDDLNPQQREAVTAGDGAVLVLAGPGSGKTRVLTRRLAYLVERINVPAYNIIAVTFTNKAAREMDIRVRSMIQQNLEGIWLGTFHAMCARLLRREANYLPYQANFVIFDSDDQLTLVKRALHDLRIDEKTHRPAGVHAAISSAKNDLLQPDQMPIQTYRDEVVARVYKRYQEQLIANNAVDFDDLLLLAARLLEENPGVAERYARRFQHVLVDEFQDTNLAQYALLQKLSAYYGNIFAVGDEDQSIYRWRGADYRNVLRFQQDFKACKTILLEQNYRSTQYILDAARQVIDRNFQRTRKQLFTARGSGNKLVMNSAVDDIAEAGFVADTIQQYLSTGKAQASDFAVMYRTNAQSRLVEEAMLRANLPYHLVGALRFYGRREVKDLIAFMRLIENPGDEVSLLRVINVPPRKIGDKALLSLQSGAFQANLSPGEVLLDLGRNGESSPHWSGIGQPAAVLAKFGALLSDWNARKDSLALADLLDRILNDTGYEYYINDQSDEGNDRWENLQELRRLAEEFNDKGLIEFLQNLALVSDQDTLPAEGAVDAGDALKSVTLLTLHAAKGLEFNQVFIIGLDEGVLPHSRALSDAEEVAEERRLFYVGMTRAKNQLYLLRSERRLVYGSREYSEPSRFLNDISDDLIINQGKRSASRRESRFDDMRWTTTGVASPYSPPRKTQEAPIESLYKPGMRVRTAAWGEGIVLESRIDRNGEETLDVHFESVGFKRLLAALANLEIVQ